jgi:uncharacterized repeat protein (TIGR03803 family)
MRSLGFSRYVLSIGVAVGLLSDCGGSQSPLGAAPVSVQVSRADHIAHRSPLTSGADPLADLINVNNTFYGTTYGGGFKSGCRGSGCGTIFALTP